MLIFEWDDLPHLLSILFLSALVWFLWRALESRAALHFVVAGILMAMMMLANAFGMIAIAFTVITLPLAMDGSFSSRLNWLRRPSGTRWKRILSCTGSSCLR